MRYPLHKFLILVSILFSTLHASDNNIEQIIKIRLAGQLDEAKSKIDKLLKLKPTAKKELALRLERAVILDREGLHHNKRPVTEALLEIELASKLSKQMGPQQRGLVYYALATYFYRAEMAERTFTKAQSFSEKAINQLTLAGDTHGTADAVHRLGLIHFQRREMERARELFDRSLELDNKAGTRQWMLGEYHRHVGYIYQLADDWQTALSHFEKSFLARKNAGAIDASMFAANTLSSAQIKLGLLNEAYVSLEYVFDIANKINSPVGMSRAYFNQAKLAEKKGDFDSAITAYENLLTIARPIAYHSLIKRSENAIRKLTTQL